MPGIFGDLFDIDGNGELDCVEQAADFLAFQQLTDEDDDASADDIFNDDFDDNF